MIKPTSRVNTLQRQLKIKRPRHFYLVVQANLHDEIQTTPNFSFAVFRSTNVGKIQITLQVLEKLYRFLHRDFRIIFNSFFPYNYSIFLSLTAHWRIFSTKKIMKAFMSLSPSSLRLENFAKNCQRAHVTLHELIQSLKILNTHLLSFSLAISLK